MSENAKKPSDTLRWCGARKGITKTAPCQNRKMEMRGTWSSYFFDIRLGSSLPGITENQLKSLIMAQIERWRHG